MFSLKLIALMSVLLMTLLSGFYPFFKKLKTSHGHEFLQGESLAAGVFLGAGLIHMLGSAAQSFHALHISYPVPFLLTGLTFLLLLLLEHISREVYKKEGAANASFAILAVVMLSIHSFLTGAALGLTTSLSMFLIILAAILAHKWAESFALAVQINKSHLSLKTGIIWFLVFALMTPLGIISGTTVIHYFSQYPMIPAILTALSAGTFLYLGTLHGLESAILVKQCCDLKRFSLVIIGFFIMAIVALWT